MFICNGRRFLRAIAPIEDAHGAGHTPVVVSFPFADVESTSDGEECFTPDGCDCVSKQCIEGACAAGGVFSTHISLVSRSIDI